MFGYLITTYRASLVLNNSEVVHSASHKRQLFGTTNCSLTVNDGVASLIAWLDHSCQKTEFGGMQGHAPCRKILLHQTNKKKKQIAPSPQQLSNGHWVQRTSGFKSKCHGIRFGTLNVGSLCGRRIKCVKN